MLQGSIPDSGCPASDMPMNMRGWKLALCPAGPQILFTCSVKLIFFTDVAARQAALPHYLSCLRVELDIQKEHFGSKIGQIPFPSSFIFAL